MPKTKEFVESEDDLSSDEASKKKTKSVESKRRKVEEEEKDEEEEEEEEDQNDSAEEKKTKKKPAPKAAAAATASNAKSSKATKKDSKSSDEFDLYPLDKSRFISVSEFKGNVLINIREYYEKDGKKLPGKKGNELLIVSNDGKLIFIFSKGISLSVDQWKKLKSFINKVDDDIGKVNK